MRLHQSVIALAALCTLLSSAQAHVAAAPQTNNRYLKLTPLGDRLRLAYTVYFGTVPGGQARVRIDENHDGTIDDAEAQTFGDSLAAQIAPNIELVVDDEPIAFVWAAVDVGLGTAETSGGAFSVDMIAWPCLSSPKTRSAHTLVLTDRFQVPRPGETEVRVVESPGVTIGRSAFGKDGKRSQLEFKWMGAGGPLAQVGYYLDFETDPKTAPMANDGHCKRKPVAATRSGLALPIKLTIVGGLAAVIGLALFLFLRRRDANES